MHLYMKTFIYNIQTIKHSLFKIKYLLNKFIYIKITQL